MRTAIIFCSLTFILLLTILSIDPWFVNAFTITSIPVQYNCTKIYQHTENRISLDFDRKNNIWYMVGGSQKVNKRTGDGTVVSSPSLTEIVPVRISGQGSRIYVTDEQSPKNIHTWDGSSPSINLFISGAASSGNDNVFANSTTTADPLFVRVSPITGDLYFSEECRVRRVSGDKVYAFAGTITCGESGDGSLAVNAFMNRPQDIAFTQQNEVLVVDKPSDYKLRMIYNNGTINTIATFPSPPVINSITIGDNGDIYVAQASKIVKISNGVETRIAGGGENIFTASIESTLDPTSFIMGPFGIAMGNNNSFYFTHHNRLYQMIPYCPAGYTLSPDNMVCYPICYGIVATSQSVCSNNNGSCTAPDTCSCNSGSGYGGTECKIPICYGYLANDTSNVCSGAGSCISPNHCVCQANYSGSNCNITSCFGISNTNTNSVCSGRGSCKHYNTCTCSQSYYDGQQCQNTYCHSIASTDSGRVCSSNGICSDYNQCICNSKWYGNYCNVTECSGILSNLTTSVCSGAGSCISPNNCSCNDGYNGTNCENFDCFGVSVNSGKSGCLNNGTCSGPGNCACLPTYYGKTCEISTCYGILSNYTSSVCSGHGTCSMLDTCQCNTNYYGNNCSFSICFGLKQDDINVCSQHGICYDANKCNCTNGYRGWNCEHNICYGFDSGQSTVCSSNGSCIAPDSCQCKSGYRGLNCQYVELVMDAKTAVLTSVVSNDLTAFAPSTSVSCQSIFSTKDLSYLGGSDTVRCIWNKNMFKIYLGYGHFVYDNMTMDIKGNGKNFTLQISLVNATGESYNSGATIVVPQLATIPKTNLVVRSYTPPTFQAFRNTSLIWSCTGACTTISPLLSTMNDKPVILIGSNQLPTSKFSLSVTSKNWLGKSVTSSVVDFNYQVGVPYFELASDNSGNQFTCSGFDCIIEINSISGSSPQVYFESPFDVLNSNTGNSIIRLLNRYSSTILPDSYEKSMKLQRTSNTNSLSYTMTYTSFEDVPLVLINTDKDQYIGNSLTISVSFIDPMVKYLKSSDNIGYEWTCSSSTSRDGIYTEYICPTSVTADLVVPRSKLSLGSYHSFQVKVYLDSGRIVSTKSGIVYVVSSTVPDILFDSVPPVYPPSKNLVLNAVISSSTAINDVVWKVTSGNLLNQQVLNQATRISLDGNNIKSTLIIDKSYLLQGDSYTFSVSANNDAGTGTAFTSTVIDVSPRITCQAYDPIKSVIIAFKSDVVVDCTAISDYSIASYHVDVYFNTTRVMTLSKTMKKSFITKLPYGPNGEVRIEIRAVNKIGSVSSTSLNLKVSAPYTDTTLSERINFASSEYNSIKASLTRLESVTTMHCLVLWIIQQNSLSDFASIPDDSKTSITTLLNNMLSTLNSLTSISYNADDKLAPVFIPFANDVYKLLAVVSPSTVSSNTALLGWVKYFVSSFNNVKTYYRSTLISTIYDSKHLTEIDSLIDIGSKYISANDFTPYYKETAIISRLVNDNVNSTTTTSSTIVDSSGTETSFYFVDRLSQLDSKVITFTNYPTISITFPSNFYQQKGSSVSGSGITLSSSVSITSKSSQAVISPIVDISIFTSSGSVADISGLVGNLIQISYGSLTQPKANFTNLNYTCRYLNTTSSEWSQDGVSSSVNILSDDGKTVTFSLTCLTTHLTSFSIVSAPIPQTSTNNRFSQDNTGTIVGAVLGTLLPLLLIAVIVVVVIVIVVFILKKRRRAEVESKVRNIELVNESIYA